MLLSAEFARQYWRAAWPEAEWQRGGAWKLMFPDGRVGDAGEIVAFEPMKRLAIRWRNEFKPEFKAEGWSLCTMEIEPEGEAVKLTVSHEMEREGSRFIDAVSGGWPQILSNLKSLLAPSTYLDEQFEQGREMLYLPPGDIRSGDLDYLADLVRDRHRLDDIATRAAAIYRRDHTWTQRAAWIDEAINGQVGAAMGSAD